MLKGHILSKQLFLSLIFLLHAVLQASAAEYSIREAIIADAEALVSLKEQLGYPCALEEIKERIATYQARPLSRVFVAELTINHKVVGYISLSIDELFDFKGRSAHITGFIVDEKHRKKGIGKGLLLELEKYATRKGCAYIDLVSGVWRASTGVHDFYKKRGYLNEGSYEKVYLRKNLLGYPQTQGKKKSAS